MRLLTVIATVCVVGAVSQNDGAAQEPKKKSSPVVRVLKGWSLDKLGGDEEMVAWDYRYRAFYGPDADLGWPGVGAVYKSLDPIATLYRDKDFLRKLDKEVDFSKNVLLRYAWRGGGPPVSYHFSGTKEGPVVLFSRRLLRTRDQIPGSTELIIPADVYKRSVKLGLQDR